MNSLLLSSQPQKRRPAWIWLGLAVVLAILLALTAREFTAAYWLYWGDKAFARIFYEDVGFSSALSSVLGTTFSIFYAAALIHLAGRSTWHFLGGKLTGARFGKWAACYIFAFAFPHLIHAVAAPFNNTCFNQRTGEPNKWYTVEGGQIILSDSAGYDGLGSKRQPVTADICETFNKQRSGIRPHRVNTNPDKIEFFDAITRSPRIWYSRRNDQISLYDGSGFDPESGEPLLPITSSVIAEIKAQAQLRAKQSNSTLTSSRPNQSSPEDKSRAADREKAPDAAEHPSIIAALAENNRGATPERVAGAVERSAMTATTENNRSMALTRAVNAVENSPTVAVTSRNSAPTDFAQADDASFKFTVCNRTNIEAAVAVMGRETSAKDLIVKGWMRVPPTTCKPAGTFARGDFFMTAAGAGISWGSGPMVLCVPGATFRTIHNQPRQCQPSERLARFTRARITTETWTWNLN